MSKAGDFFVAGGTLRAGAPSYVTRPADADLLRSALAGDFCYVLTPRQMGKSSLMVRTAQKIRARGARPVIIDLTSIGTVTSDEWYLGLLSRLRTGLRLDVELETWWQGHANLSAAHRFILFLRDVLLASVPEPIVIFIDEIDSTLNLDFRDDFFAAIRALYNARASEPIYSRLTFVLLGVATPTDLINDRERTPFNIGRRIELKEFSTSDAAPLLTGLGSVFAEQSEQIFQRIFYWSNGHPYLTQKLCVVATHAGGAPDDAAVDQLVAETFLSEEGRKDTNLTFVQDRIINSPPTERVQMLQLYRQVYEGRRIADDDRSSIQNRLELYGLLAVRENHLHVRNAIYRHVFNADWIKSATPADPQRRRAIYAVIAALVIVIGVITYTYLQSDPECSTLIEVFERTRSSSGRASTLARLFAQGDRCREDALKLFYGLNDSSRLEDSDRLQLFSNALSLGQNDLVTLVQNIAVTLEPWPDGHDVDVMAVMHDALLESGLPDDDPRIRRIRNWISARNEARSDNHAAAVRYYKLALSDDTDFYQPTLHFGLAQSFIALAQYADALRELDQVIRIAGLRPTPTLPPTAAASLTSAQEASKPQTPLVIPTQESTIAAAIRTVAATRTLSSTASAGSVEPIQPVTTTVRSSAHRYSHFVKTDDMNEVVRATIQRNTELHLVYSRQREQYPKLLSISAGLILDPEHIFGLHEPGGEQLMLDAGKPGWIVFSEEIGHDPNNFGGKDFTPWSNRGLGVIVRINHGYHPNGTLPISDLYEDFALRCANFVANSPGAHIWIIGNEPNFDIERPALASRNDGSGPSPGEVITPDLYARAFSLARDAIHAVPGHSGDQVVIAPVAPWNNQTQYPGNPNGDWVQYFHDILTSLGPGGLDGIAIHTYTHGTDPNLVNDNSKLNVPYENRHYHFYAYRDFMNAIPGELRNVPVYITETNQDTPWRDENTGWVQRAYGDINWWNSQPRNQKILALVLHRWPNFDRWVIETKPGVIEDFRQALTNDYRWTSPQLSESQQVAATATPLSVQESTFEIGDIIVAADNVRVRRSPGIIDKPANDVLGVFEPRLALNIIDGPRRADSLNWWRVGGITADSGAVIGWVLEEAPNGDQILVEPETLPGTNIPNKNANLYLGPPLTGSLVLSQLFGENPQTYSAITYDGVPLKGNIMLDFDAPIGTPVMAVDDGSVMNVVIDDGSGFGNYIKVAHAWGESIYAHLDSFTVKEGESIRRGQVIARSGNTGFSVGPHLAVGIRINPYERADGWGGFSDPLPYFSPQEIEIPAYVRGP